MKRQILFLFLLFTAVLQSQVRLTEVNPSSETLKIKNFGMMSVNISSYMICDHDSNYRAATNMGAPMTLMPNAEVTLSTNTNNIKIDSAAGNLALYRNAMNYASTSNMLDFVQWGAPSGGRESVAASKGIWNMGMFLMNPGPYRYTGNGNEMGNRMMVWTNGSGTGGGGMGGMMMVRPHTDKLMYTARLSGSSGGSGLVVFSLSANRDSLCLQGHFTNLSSNITALRLMENTPGGPQMVEDLSSFVTNNHLEVRYSASHLGQTFIEKLIEEKYFVGLATTNNPSGELSGNVTLERDMMYGGMLSDEQHVHNVNPGMGLNPWGLASFTLTQDKSTLRYMVVANELSGNISAATLMYGQPGKVGNMVFNLANDIMTGRAILKGEIDLTNNAAFVDSLMAGSVYVNLATMRNGTGEIRGQLHMEKGLQFDIMLDTAQVMRGNPQNTNAMGLGLVSIDPTFDTLRYDVIVEGAASALNSAELLDATDMNNMTQIMDISSQISGNRIRGMVTGSNLTNTMVQLALKGDICFTIGSMNNPMGELAGHVIKFARDGFNYTLSGNAMVPAVSGSGRGIGMIALDRNWSSAHYMVSVGNLSSAVTMASFHEGAMGQNGGMLKDITPQFAGNGTEDFGSGFWTSRDMTSPFMMMDAQRLWADSLYLQVNTMQNTSGELRGQTTLDALCSNAPTINLSENEVTTFSFFPNPAQEHLIIEKPDNQEHILRIVNSQGQVVHEQLLQQKMENVNLDNLKAGFYILTLGGEAAATGQKLLIR